jgi:cytochrome d ubiquinol oxidase subunit I
VYLYGWDRISPRAHLFAGIMVALSGTASAVFVVMANAWMNSPAGFDLVDGRMVSIDPIAGMLNPAAFPEALHMTLASFAATGLAVAGIHAFLLLRRPNDPFHRRAFGIALLVGAPAAILQPISGDISARYVAKWQPAKLAAMEGQFETVRGAPLRIGGLPDEATRTTRWAIEVPKALSLLAFHELNAEVKGLDAFPETDWPPVRIVHLAFQVMVGLGSAMALVSLWAVWIHRRKRDVAVERRFLRAVVLVAPMGFVAIEAGWIVTEVGRQPWIVYNIFRTADAVTPMPGLVYPLVLFTGIYIFLALVVVWLLYRQIVRSPTPEELGAGGAPTRPPDSWITTDEPLTREHPGSAGSQ